jgi:hypothetical protein
MKVDRRLKVLDVTEQSCDLLNPPDSGIDGLQAGVGEPMIVSLFQSPVFGLAHLVHRVVQVFGDMELVEKDRA